MTHKTQIKIVRHGDNSAMQFLYLRLTLIPVKCGMKLIVHSQTSMIDVLESTNSFIPNFIKNVIITHTGTKINPC